MLSSFFFVGVPGFEPGTPCSQSRCANRTALHPELKPLKITLRSFSSSSGYQDSNLGPPAPKAGALTGLRYTPNLKPLKQFLDFSTSGYQDSNLGPPAPKAGALTGLRYTPNCFFSIGLFLNCGCKGTPFFDTCKHFGVFFRLFF